MKPWRAGSSMPIAAMQSAVYSAYAGMPRVSTTSFLSRRWTTITADPSSSSRPATFWRMTCPWWTTTLRSRSGIRMHALHSQREAAAMSRRRRWNAKYVPSTVSWRVDPSMVGVTTYAKAASPSSFASRSIGRRLPTTVVTRSARMSCAWSSSTPAR